MAEFTPVLEDADLYFSPENHIRASEWRNYETAQRKAALATAKRELESYLDRELDEPFTGEIFDNTTHNSRDDWACYEQALDSLDRQHRVGPHSKVKKLGAVKADEGMGPRIAPAAMSFLKQGRLKTSRG